MLVSFWKQILELIYSLTISPMSITCSGHTHPSITSSSSCQQPASTHQAPISPLRLLFICFCLCFVNHGGLMNVELSSRVHITHQKLNHRRQRLSPISPALSIVPPHRIGPHEFFPSLSLVFLYQSYVDPV